MNSVFPKVASGPITEARPRAVIRFQRSGTPLLAIVTGEATGESRSLVVLNKPTQHGLRTTFIENWRNPETVLIYTDGLRFELNMDIETHDPQGNRSWETAGVLVAIGDRILVRAYHESVFGDYKLIDVQTGSLYAGSKQSNPFSFLAWQLWIRDAVANRHVMLWDFDASAQGGLATT